LFALCRDFSQRDNEGNEGNEEKVDVLAKHSECDWFEKADPFCREYTGMDSIFQTLDGSLYRVEKKVPWICY